MRRWTVLLRTECKRIFKCSPAVCLQFIVLAALLLLSVVLGNRALHQDKLQGRIRIGILAEDENPLTEYALNMLQNMEGLKEGCDFIRLNHLQEKGELDAVIVLPAGMTEGILKGENIPARVFLYGRDGVRQILLEELIRSGVSVLSSAQAQIYSAYELLNQYQREDMLAEAGKHLNLDNLALAMGHERIFKDVALEVTGELPESVHFASSIVVLFLLLMGLNCCYYAAPENRELEKQLGRLGYTAFQQVTARFAAVAVNLSVWLTGFLILVCLCIGQLPGMADYMELSDIGMPGGAAAGGLLVLILLVSALQVWVLTFADGITGAVLSLALGSFALLFVSGGFIPGVFLPESVRTIGRVLPGQELIRLASGFFTGRPGGVPGMKIAVYLGFFLLTAVWAAERRRQS